MKTKVKMRQQILTTVFAVLACAAFAQNGASSQGGTAIKTQFVDVQPDVKLEVLDWGGTGRNLVLLAGLGNTAHVFDSLAPKLAVHYHVIGITRRGFGQSSAPQTGYGPRRLGDDVVAVLDALHIADPVLVGHSIAGEELSAISTYHPGRAAALVYLDAGAPFALYNPKHGDYTPALAQLKDDLSALQKNLFDDDLISKTLTDMTLFQANLAELRGEVEGATPPAPKDSDRASIAAFQSYMKGYFGGIIPESEVRQDFRIGDDGKVGEWLGHGYPNQSVMLAEERFLSIETPLLAIFSYPSAPFPSQTSDSAKLAASRAAEISREESQISIFRQQPHAKVVVIPNGTHYIFLSREQEVISHITDFVNSLPTALAEAETLYADLADSYGVITTIDSGLFATYQGKDRAAWERVYAEKRKQLTEKLSRITASSLSPLDARALDVMNRHLRDDFPEQFNDQNAPPEHCQDAQRKDLSMTSLEGALHSCFTEIGNNLEFEGKRVTRVSALGMLEEINEEERRKKLFYAFEPLWNAVDGKRDAASPYRRLLPLVVAAAQGHGTKIDDAARTIGVSSAEVERWLEQILDTWRQVDGGQMVEPWNYFYRSGEAARLLSAVTPKDSFVAVNQRSYRDLGADLQQLGVLYDLEARPGKAPLAYTDYVTRGRFVDGKWRETVVHISGSYATGGLGLLNELVHENGHAVYMMAIRERPAFMDVSAALFDEAFADVPSWNTYEPAWQRKYLGQSASEAASLRGLFSSVMLDVAWALFECRMLRNPAADPNTVWTDITNHYLHIVRHPEISWWALRGQLVQMPGYMVNYGLGSVLTADIRQHTREGLGPFETGNPQWYSWTSERLLRFGEEQETSALLKQFLGRPVSQQALLDQIRRIAPKQ